MNLPVEPVVFDPEIETLLARAGLPTADLAGNSAVHLLGMRTAGAWAGIVGVERCGDTGLLRSLAVDPGVRGGSLGTRLVAAAEAWAVANGIRTLYLLTTTASAFFADRGYETLPRDQAPAAIAATAQFSGLCPGSSTFMRKALTGG